MSLTPKRSLSEDFSAHPSKKRTIRNESRCYTTNTQFECDFTWTIEHFTLHLGDKCHVVRSPTFSAGENACKWTLELHVPSGEYTDMTLKFVIYDTTELDKLGPINGNLRCSIINAEGEEVEIRTKRFSLNSSHLICTIDDFVCIRGNRENQGKLLSQDELTIHCAISYIHLNNSVDIVVGGDDASEVNSCYPMKDFVTLLNNEEFSDVTIFVKGKKYPAHKNILAIRSSVFKAMLTHDMKERNQNRIDINDIDAKVFQEVLRFIYTGKVDTTETAMLFGLLLAADKYDLAVLHNLCRNALSKLLTAETAVEILSFSDTHNILNLKTQAIGYITTNIKNITNTTAWNDLIRQPDLMKVIVEACAK